MREYLTICDYIIVWILSFWRIVEEKLEEQFKIEILQFAEASLSCLREKFALNAILK